MGSGRGVAVRAGRSTRTHTCAAAIVLWVMLILQSALFHFSSLLLVILLCICTCTYVRATAPGIVDRNKNGPMGLCFKAARIGECLRVRRRAGWVDTSAKRARRPPTATAVCCAVRCHKHEQLTPLCLWDGTSSLLHTFFSPLFLSHRRAIITVCLASLHRHGCVHDPVRFDGPKKHQLL